MNYQEFRSVAIESAELYYQFLTNQKKGFSSVGVRSIEGPSPDGILRLGLAGGLNFTSDLQIRVKDIVFSPDEIAISQYDERSRTLDIRPQKQFLHLFTDPKEIYVISDLKFLVQRVRSWYANHTAPLALPEVPPALDPDMEEFSTPLSQEQSAAFHGIFSSPLSYVWGAPGTGKTQFVLARAVLAYCLEGKQVLIAAPTNNAVEQTLRGVLPILEEAGIPLSKVLRIGVPSKEFYKKYPMVCEVRSVENELAQIDERLDFLRKALAYFDALDWLTMAEDVVAHQCQVWDALEVQAAELSRKIDALEQARRRLQCEYAPIFTQIEHLTTRKSQLIFLLGRKRTRLSARLYRRTLGEAKLELSDVEKNLNDCKARHEALLQESEDMRSRLEQTQSVRSDVLARRNIVLAALQEIPPSPFPSKFTSLVSSFSAPIDKAILPAASAMLHQIRCSIEKRGRKYVQFSPGEAAQEIETLSRRKSQIGVSSTSARIPECLVVAATVDGCISKLQESEGIHPCHVFLDEAAYCPLIKGFTLLSFDSPLTLLGDHMQIPPVCEADDHYFLKPELSPLFLWAQSSLYLENVFCKSLKQLSSDYQNESPPLLAHLKKYDLLHTFRFGKALAAILARFVYTADFRGNERIDTNIIPIHAPLSAPLPKKNTSPAEAEAILQYLSQHPCTEYAVLTPYRNQRALLASADPGILSPEDVFTIHGSQGREWDTVFLSVASPVPTRFLTPRLINTAVSRTKKTLVIACDCESWSRHPDHIIGALIARKE